MTTRLDHENDTTRHWRSLAIAYPETEEGATCVKSSFRVRKKAFLFVGAKPGSYNVMVKLKDGIAEAEKLAAEQPELYKVGKGGWVTVHYPQGQRPPEGLFERWIDESFRLVAPKTLLKQLASK